MQQRIKSAFDDRIAGMQRQAIDGAALLARARARAAHG